MVSFRNFTAILSSYQKEIFLVCSKETKPTNEWSLLQYKASLVSLFSIDEDENIYEERKMLNFYSIVLKRYPPVFEQYLLLRNFRNFMKFNREGISKKEKRLSFGLHRPTQLEKNILERWNKILIDILNKKHTH